MSINKRVLELVKLKTGGNKAKFADIIGWKPQYMSRVTKDGGPAGLALVERILTAFPDVSPHWLIFGKGDITVPDRELEDLIDKKIAELRKVQKNSPTYSGDKLTEIKKKIQGFLID